MQRRNFIKSLFVGGVGSTLLLNSPPLSAKPEFRWKMLTVVPKNFPGVGESANYLAKLIETMSQGRIRIKVYGANELVPAFGIFDAVRRGVGEIGHSSSYYWKGNAEAVQFFATVPFGMTGRELSSWIYYGGGIELWREIYDDFGLVPFLVGNSGVQMAGWFNREINSAQDLKGLKMRIPGLGGEILSKAGGTPILIPGSEVFTSLKTGAIDACEWMSPYNDMAFGLQNAARYYYYPGWHEPGTALEAFINKKALQSLPKDLQLVVEQACRITDADLLSFYSYNDPLALSKLKNELKVDIRPLPEDALTLLQDSTYEVLEEMVARDPVSKKVYDSYYKFLTLSDQWTEISEKSYLNTRKVR